MIYTLENARLRARVHSKGAELWSLWDKDADTEHIWQGDPEVWAWRAPILFPICSRLRDDTLRIDGRAYSMPLHGFARDFEHELVEQTGCSLRLRMVGNPETLTRYPFRFQLDSVFTLEGDSLCHRLEVVNRDEAVLPFSIGFHTGYRVPFDARRTVRDYCLLFDQPERATELVSEASRFVRERPFWVDGQGIPLRDDLFPSSICLAGVRSTAVRLAERDSTRAVRVAFEGFPILALWSTPGRVPFVCIEPWHGLFEPAEDYADFRDKPYLEKLGPGQSFACAQTITIER